MNKENGTVHENTKIVYERERAEARQKHSEGSTENAKTKTRPLKRTKRKGKSENEGNSIVRRQKTLLKEGLVLEKTKGNGYRLEVSVIESSGCKGRDKKMMGA